MSVDEKLLKEAKKLPWKDRLMHKNWKVRNDANIDLAAVCDSITDPKDHRLRVFGQFFKKTVADSIAPVQEKALDALIAYLKAADADAGRYAKEVCDAIVAKCLTGRPKTVEKAQAAFMLWVELEAVQTVLDAMEKTIKNKVAKAVVLAIDVMFQALSEFGSKVVPPKRILKILPELFDHQDQNVRASSKGLTLELCRWIGKDPVKSILFEKMRDTMKKELEAELVNVTGSAKPIRKIRSEQDKEPEQEAISEIVRSGPSKEPAANKMSVDEKLLKEAKKLPWKDRLMHKNWKVRNDANIDLAAVCDSITDPKDHRLRVFGQFFKKTVADSIAPVQEKALDALIAYLKAADADAGRYAKEVCDAIVAKCLTGRPKTVEKAQAAFMLWVELEAVQTVLDAMEKTIKNKVAKAVVLAIDVMFQALSEFGSKVVPPKRILKILPELFDHQDQNVRASSKGLTLELCRWIGKDPVKSILFEKMRDTMKKELEAELVNVTGSAKPIRKIRSEQDKEPEQDAVSEIVRSGPSEEPAADIPEVIDEYELVDPVDILTPLEKSRFEQDKEPEQEAVSEIVRSGPSEEPADDIPEVIDEYELVDPVDILTPLEKSGFWDGVKATKWSEQKEAVSELTKLASTKRIAPGDFTEICRTLKKLITDVNIAVAVEAIQAIGNLATGLRTHFSGNSRFLLPVLLEKLKEKKPTSIEALTQTLQAMHKSGCLNLADIVEDVKTATKNKVPLVRSLTLNWVTFCIETSNKAVILKVHKEYVPICMECLNDGMPDVRDAAFSALAAMAKLVGMRPLEMSLEKLDDDRKKKLSEMIESFGGGQSTVTCTIQSSGGCVSSKEDVSYPLTQKIKEISDNLRLLCTSSRTEIPKNPVTQSAVERDLSTPMTFSTRSSLQHSLIQQHLNFFNSASKEELKSVKGIGEKRATYILQRREETPEPFKQLDDLQDLGLSMKQINAMMKNVAGSLFN